jgi:hypothetical protein
LYSSSINAPLQLALLVTTLVSAAQTPRAMLHFTRSHHDAHRIASKSVVVTVDVMMLVQVNTVLTNTGVRT